MAEDSVSGTDEDAIPEADDDPVSATGEGSATDDETVSQSPEESSPAIPDDSLVVWGLASFHAGLLVAILVTALHLSGPIGDLLGGLSTTVGLVLYLGLWATTWWTNRRWLRAVADPEVDGSVVLTGTTWGGVNGVCFFWVLAVVNVAPFITLQNLARLEVGVAALSVFAGIVGSVLALGIGGVVGSLFAMLDLALVRAAARIVPEPDE